VTVEEKLGSDVGLTDSEDETEEDEDEDGDDLTAAADVAIFKTLAKIRDKDPVIYQKDINVFERELSVHCHVGLLDTDLFRGGIKIYW
jgi:protein KRI1